MSRRYRVDPESTCPYFITCTAVEWLPVFISARYCEVITDSLAYCREYKGLLTNAYVVMPTHIHAIVTPMNENLSDVMRDFKRHTSRTIRERLQEDRQKLFLRIIRGHATDNSGRSDFKVGQDEFQPEKIYLEKFFWQKCNYLHDNPCRKGLVTQPDHWRWSSARWYARGEPCEVEITPVEFLPGTQGW